MVSTELFSSATCPLNCKYCYIPKTSQMGFLQDKIITNLDQREYLDTLKRAYGQNLQYLGFWGTEPTLTLKKIQKSLSFLFKTFPKLVGISFSTNLLTNPEIILNFIKALTKTRKKINLKVQISIDGPDFITDINRGPGATKKITENFFYLISKLNTINLTNLNVRFSLKPTLSIDNIKILNKKKERLRKYFDFFEKIFQEFKRKNKNQKVSLLTSCTPTLVCPGKYTSVDGKELAIFFRNLRILGKQNKKNQHWKYVKSSLNTYVYRLKRLFDYQNELFIKPYMFTCSGGDSNFGVGIDNDLHICHRSFFLNNQEYIESILKNEEIKNWDVSLFEKGNLDLIKNKFIVDINKLEEKIRLFYVGRNYHDFTRLKISYTLAMLQELVLVGQASECYLDEDLAILFAIFLNLALGCPTENVLNTGVIHFSPISMIRLFANGAFEEILKEYIEWQKK